MMTYSNNMTVEEVEAYRHERAALVMEALKKGMTARQIYGATNEIDKSTLFYTEYGKTPKRKRTKAIWTDEGVKAYALAHPIWGHEFSCLATANAKASHYERASWNRDKTHCRKGHLLIGDNVAIYSRKGRDDHFRRCRTCQRDRDKTSSISPQQARAALIALRSGETIASITGGGKPTFVLSHKTLMALRRSDPKLNKLIVDLSAKNAKPRWLEAMRKRRVLVASPALSHNMSALDQISAAVPRYIPDSDRQDIIADMWTAIAEGQLNPSDIAAKVNRFVAAHRKMYQTTDRWGPKSLDAPAYLDSPVSLIETLREDQGLWR